MAMPSEPYVLSASMSLPLRREQVIAFFAEAQNLAYFTGPNNLRHHTHTFTETDEGTIIGDRVLNRLPLLPLGACTLSTIKLPRTRAFSYRQKAIGKIKGSCNKSLGRGPIFRIYRLPKEPSQSI